MFARYKSLCGNRKGLDVTVFDALVDELAVLYGASRAAAEGLVHGEGKWCFVCCALSLL